MTTNKEVKKSFWKEHPHLKKYYQKDKTEFNTDVRSAFADYVAKLKGENIISHDLYMTASLNS